MFFRFYPLAKTVLINNILHYENIFWGETWRCLMSVGVAFSSKNTSKPFLGNDTIATMAKGPIGVAP
jgi:hypothetical protein